MIEDITSRQIYDIEKIFEVVLAFNSAGDLTSLLGTILDKMMEITDSDAGTLYTVDEGKLHFRIIRNRTLGIFQSSESDEIDLPPIVLDKCNIQNISAYSAINNKIVLVDDVYAPKKDFNFSGPKNYDKITGYRTRAMLVLPICTHRGADDEVLGVIQLMNPIDPVTGEAGVYGNIYKPPIIPALAKVAANTLSNLTYVKELQQMLRSVAAVMTQAIDERSHYTNNHTQKVAMYCEAFANYLNSAFPRGHKFHFNKRHLESFVLAALLHDIGKIATPLYIMDKPTRLSERIDVIRYKFELKKHQTEINRLHKRISDERCFAEMAEISETLALVEQLNTELFLNDEQVEKVLRLREITYKDPEGTTVPLFHESDIEALSVKQGTITAAERKIMQQHVELTGRLLDKIPFWKYFGDIPKWARTHHEFLDGTGYPLKLSGDEIPLESCIITIMDIFDALTDTDRPYKKGVPIDKSLEILEDMAKKGKLHKELVHLFKESKIWEGII